MRGDENGILALSSEMENRHSAGFGGVERRAPIWLRAESLGYDSLGWSAQRAAPGQATWKSPQPCKGVTIRHAPGAALQASWTDGRRVSWACARRLASAQAFTGRAFSPRLHTSPAAPAATTDFCILHS